ncbi:hypothetical protein GGS20DRAFT_589826 [Poronia punctata]|nr:hypothetical protein GGS20DRAFT_589826 [Poronia punctata]
MNHQAPIIEYPAVPPGEEDPFGRINTMIKIFNENLPPPTFNKFEASIDTGLLFEIGAAKKLTSKVIALAKVPTLEQLLAEWDNVPCGDDGV